MPLREQKEDLTSELERIIDNADAQLVCLCYTKEWWREEIDKLRIKAYSDFARIIIHPLKQEGT